MIKLERTYLGVVAFVGIVTALVIPSPAQANLFVSNADTGTISEYSDSGLLLKDSLITGAGFILDTAIAGNKLYVLTNDGGVAVYTTAGQTINRLLISGPRAEAIAVS